MKKYSWVFTLLLGLYLLIPWSNSQKKADLQNNQQTPTFTATEINSVSLHKLPFLNILEVTITNSPTFIPSLTPLPTKEVSAEKIVVKFKDNIAGQDIAKNFQDQLEMIPFLSEETGIYRIKVGSNEDINQVYAKYKQHPGVESVDFDRKIKGLLITPVIPNDPDFSKQWALNNINLPKAWSMEKGNNEIKIAVLDTGVDGTHEELSGKVEAGISFIGYSVGTPIPDVFMPVAIQANTNSDDNGHGTSVSGIVAALTNNNKGISGVVWDSKIVPIKVLDWESKGDESATAAGIIWASNQKDIQIICMSLGGEVPSLDIETAVRFAFNKGKVLIAASGNKDRQGVYYPAAYPEVIAVGANNQDDTRANRTNWGGDRGSSYGPELSLLAPGSSIYTLGWKTGAVNSYENFTGTSAASPHVCGVAALLMAFDPSLSNRQIQRRLQLSADKVAEMAGSNFTNEHGYGRVNAYKALAFDVYPPVVTFDPIASVLPTKPTISGKAIEDKTSSEKVHSNLVDVSNSNIEKVEISLDNGNWQEIVPSQKTGLFNFNYTVEKELTEGTHFIKARAYDTNNNVTLEENYAVLNFIVSREVTPITNTPISNSTFTFTPTPTFTNNTSETTFTPSFTFTWTPIPKPPDNLEVRVLYRYYTSADKSNYKDYPISGVKVLISDLPWEKYTDISGVAYFDGVLAGKHLVTAFYGNVTKQMEVSVPSSKSLTIIFESQVAALLPTPSDSDNQMPETGMNLFKELSEKRFLLGILLISYSFFVIIIGIKKQGN